MSDPHDEPLPGDVYIPPLPDEGVPGAGMGIVSTFIRKIWPQSFSGAFMAAPSYLNLSPPVSGWVFWGLSIVGSLGLFYEIFSEARRSKGQPKRHRAIAWAGIALGAAIFLSFSWYFWPKSNLPAPAIIDIKNPLGLDESLQSKAFKYIFLCPVPPSTDNRSFKEILADIQADARVRGDVFGVDVSILEIEHGIRINIIPKTQESFVKMHGLKYIIEVRRAGKELFVTSLIDAPGILGNVGAFMPINPKSEASLATKKMVENMVGVQDGACKIL